MGFFSTGRGALEQGGHFRSGGSPRLEAHQEREFSMMWFSSTGGCFKTALLDKELFRTVFCSGPEFGACILRGRMLYFIFALFYIVHV